MAPIRLAACGLSPFAGDIVRTLVEEMPFVEVVESLDLSDDLAADFIRSKADVLLCALPEDEMDRLWRAAVEERPRLAVLNMLDDSARGQLHTLYPHRHAVEELTQESLLHVLRRHVLTLHDGGRS